MKATAEQPKIFTVNEMKEQFDHLPLQQAIEWADSFKINYPEPAPKKPLLHPKHTAADAKDYSVSLEKWEAEKEQYDAEVKKCREHASKINALIIEYVKNRAGLHTIPEKYREKVWNYAYNKGHGSGMHEVFIELEELLSIFDA